MRLPQYLLSRLSVALPIALAAGACGEVLVASQDGGADGGDVNSPDSAPGSSDRSYDAPSIQAVLDLPSAVLSYEPDLPPHFQTIEVSALDNTGANEITDTGATLGRVLFYEQLLSSNETVACASCHDPAKGFADDQAHSNGFAGGLTGRNSMSLFNLRYYESGKMFWDERADTIEHQTLLPIQDAVEMGMELQDVVNRLEDTEHYPILFELAYGDPEISSERISLALGQFLRSIVSTQSRYDVAIGAAGNPMQDLPGFTQEENIGKNLFFGPPNMGGAGCAGCHLGPPPNLAIFQAQRPRNNGLLAAQASDRGIGGITNNPQDNGLFKTPSLRNTEKSAPYMHDGSLATLRDVVNHYNSGIQDHPTLDPALRDNAGAPVRLGLTDTEVNALVAFLRTLTDEQILADERFASPFR